MRRHLLYPFRRLAMWMVWNVPLGRFAPAFFDFAMGQEGRKQEGADHGLS